MKTNPAPATSLATAIGAVMLTPARRFQVRGVRFLERRNGRALLGDDMGLGKTYQTIAYLALHPEMRPAVVCCPATLKYNWQREFKRHAGLDSTVLEGRKPGTLTGDIWILNYDILKYWLRKLVSKSPHTFVIDECHKINNLKAQRTAAAHHLGQAVPGVIGLSGTPIKNRPVEFFSMLHMIDPVEFASFQEYAFAYCNPRLGFRGQWDFRGASNLPDLHQRLSPYILRRTKAEVLPELPKTQSTYIPVKVPLKEYERARDDFLQWLAETAGQQKVARAMRAERLVRINALLRLAAEAKLPAVKEWVHEWLDDNPSEKLVTFAIHKKIVRALREEFPKSVYITGEVTDAEKRQLAVDTFQGDPSIRLFFGNLQAAGEGTTLTAAATVLHTELSWVPGDHDQATDRVNRIGQTAGHVNAFYLVAKGTIEETIVAIQDGKRDIVSQIVNGKSAETFQELVISALIHEQEKSHGKSKHRHPAPQAEAQPRGPSPRRRGESRTG